MGRIPHPDPVEDAKERLAAEVTAAIYGYSSEDRVRELRRSILKDESQADVRLTGLVAWLDREGA